MIRAACFAVLALWGMTAAPALADKRLVTESRHPTAKERRAGRAKIEAELEKDGFRVLPKIVGGRSAADGEYPWMVGLIEAGEPDEYDGFYCGGSLIHPYWVLTAAHCVLGSRAEDIDVLVGTNDLSNPGSGAQRIAVTEIILSPTYNDITMDGDFALLRLAEPAEGTPIPVIDDRDYEIPGVEATVTGWGDTTGGTGSFPSRLQEVELPIIDLEVANATPAYDGTLTGNMLAAGLEEGGKDSCQGDSGGPLIVPSPRAPGWMQAGIVSFGEGCAEPGAYGIYTRVGNFRDFITGHIRPNYAAWERANDRSGENLDPDENGRTNFEEWALPDGMLDRELSGGKLRLSYWRPLVAPEAAYVVEHAATSTGPWLEVTDAVSAGGAVDLQEALAEVILELPSIADIGVYRVRAEPSGVYAHGPRPLKAPGGATGKLDAADEMAGGRYWKTYVLHLPEGSGPLRVSLRSRDFDAKLSLSGPGLPDHPGSLGEPSLLSDSNSGQGVNGGDEILDFTPQAGGVYQVTVTSSNAGGTGTFELNVFDPVALAAMPALTVPQAKALGGTLSAGDLPDPFFLPGTTYFKDDYLLDFSALTPGKLLELRMTSKGNAAKGIDDFLSLIDAESGRLITGNDNFAGKKNDAGLRFIPVPGKTYLLRASSSDEGDTGIYQISATSPAAGAKKSAVGAIGIGSSVSGKLAAASEIDERYFTFKYDYLLSELVADQEVVVTLESAKFDAYLMVLDASDLTVVAEGDVGGPPGGRDNAKAGFTARAGCRYLIRATTYDSFEKGPFILKTSAAP